MIYVLAIFARVKVALISIFDSVPSTKLQEFKRSQTFGHKANLLRQNSEKKDVRGHFYSAKA